MSAIAGLVRFDAPVAQQDIARMTSALAHRGPDGIAAWCGATVALGSCARRTTSHARGERQPLTDDAGRTIVAAARLDNRRELLGELGMPADAGDAAVILGAYGRWADDCASRLIGDFAFAIWDERRQQLFCGRDHIGVKPIYYHQGSSAFLFASEIKALLTSPLVPYGLNLQRVADHLVGLVDDPGITFHRDVCRLPAGHTLTVSRAGTRLRRYWAPDPVRELARATDAAYAEAFRACFTEAVRCRLDSGDVRLGALLSGGLDSSSIVATACGLRSTSAEKLDTFSAIFPGLPPAHLRRIDERDYVDAVVAQGGISPHFVRGDLLSPLTDIDRALWHLDEGFAAPNLYLHWGLYAAVREQGVGVLLDGIDGDTTVSHGLERLPALARSGRLLTLSGELRGLSRLHGVGLVHLLKGFVLPPLIAPWTRRLRGLRGDALEGSVIRRDFASRTGVVDRLEAVRAVQGSYRDPRWAHRAALTSGLVPYALELADKAAGAFGVEPRYPFFDRRLIELCLAMPPDQKLKGGWTRMVMRRAMGGVLPEEIRWRSTKASLAPNFGRRLLDKDRPLLEEIIVGQPGVIEEYVDVPALRRVYDRFVARPASETDALVVYGAAVLGLWLQRAKVA